MKDNEESTEELNDDLSSTEEPQVTSRQYNVNSIVPSSSASSSSTLFPSSSSGAAICSFEQYKISPTNFRNMNNEQQPQYPWGSFLGSDGINPLFQSSSQKKPSDFNNCSFQTPPSNLKTGGDYYSPQCFKSEGGGIGGLNYDKIDGKMIGSDRKRNRKAMLYDDNTLDDIMGQSKLFP
jgi:hypothetical protein